MITNRLSAVLAEAETMQRRRKRQLFWVTVRDVVAIVAILAAVVSWLLGWWTNAGLGRLVSGW